MNWIISPKINAAGGGVVRRGARRTRRRARYTSDKSFCDTFHAGDDAVLRQGRTTGRRRARECGDSRGAVVQGLLGVGAGLDGDQGVTAGTLRTAGAAGRRLLASAATAVSAAAPARRLAGGRLPRLARRAVRRRLLAPRRLQRQGRPRLRLQNFQTLWNDAGLPHDRAAHGRHRGARDGHRRRCSRCRSRSTWRRSRAAACAGCSSSRCSCRCGPATW